MPFIFYAKTIIKNSVIIGRISSLRHQYYRILSIKPEIHTPLNGLDTLIIAKLPICKNIIFHVLNLI